MTTTPFTPDWQAAGIAALCFLLLFAWGVVHDARRRTPRPTPRQKHAPQCHIRTCDATAYYLDVRSDTQELEWVCPDHHVEGTRYGWLSVVPGPTGSNGRAS